MYRAVPALNTLPTVTPARLVSAFTWPVRTPLVSDPGRRITLRRIPWGWFDASADAWMEFQALGIALA